ncbi:MAG: triose-phosphate isomerase [Chloroflexi bacterium]|nr:triose-phosphate isomerase [Chloroflexota bacterium]
MRIPILAGNWKMNKTAAEAVALVNTMKDELLAVKSVERVLCPPFLAVPDVSHLVAGTEIKVGAQDLYWEKSGAFTGEVAPNMVAEFCQYVIIGHSERREYFSETDACVNKKIKAALAVGLIPIVCVGESLSLRQEGRTESWIIGQVKAALDGLTAEQVAGLVIAYEPIWAIGTGLAATADEAERVCGQVVRKTIADVCGDAVAQAIRVQYGGSVKASNALELMGKPDIDGALVGGASLNASEFVSIVKSSAQAKGLS